MKAAILAIGDELLIGQVINSNGSYIGEKLSNFGIFVSTIQIVGDNESDMLEAVAQLMEKNDVVITSGGLGPTSDDITKPVLTRYFNSQLIFSQEAYQNIEKLFSRRGMPVTKLNETQAYVPDNCEIIPNSNGTAPGMIFNKDNKYLFALPGVPFEMKAMMENVMDFISQKFTLPKVHRCVFMVTGIPESHLAEKIEKWEQILNQNQVSLAYLPSPGVIRLRLTVEGLSQDQAHHLFVSLYEQLEKIVPEHLYASIETGLHNVISKLFLSHSYSLSLAESCTGGYISHLITSLSGASKFYKGGVVVYSNELKENLLYVKSETLQKYGAVSSQTACEMAEGALQILKSDYALSITGIAGPDGGSDEKPVGTVWVAVASKNGTVSSQFLFGDNRERNIIRASWAALDFLRKEVLKEKD